jgi:hypothetical protein
MTRGGGAWDRAAEWDHIPHKRKMDLGYVVPAFERLATFLRHNSGLVQTHQKTESLTWVYPGPVARAGTNKITVHCRDEYMHFVPIKPAPVVLWC